MPWNWEEILPQIPETKRQYYEILHHQAELLPDLPKTKKTAIPITEDNYEGYFFKAFEANRDFDYKYLEKRMKLLKIRWRRVSNPQETFLVYFASTILRVIKNDPTRKEAFQMRIFWGVPAGYLIQDL